MIVLDLLENKFNAYMLIFTISGCTAVRDFRRRSRTQVVKLALEKCYKIIFVLTPELEDNTFEMDMILKQLIDDNQSNRLLPVLLKDCALSKFEFNTKSKLDFREGFYDWSRVKTSLRRPL
jgi:hypothetical protein